MPIMEPGGHDAIELVAALILVIGGAFFTALSLRTRSSAPGSAAVRPIGRADPAPRPTRPSDTSAAADDGATPSVDRSLVLVMAGLSAGAAIIHLVAAPGHYAEIGDLASGFVAAAIFQAMWVRWCLAGPSRRTIAVGIAGNLAIVAAWAWSRIVGLPVGEMAGVPEPIGYPDAASIVFELALVAGLVVRLLGLDRAISRRPAARTLASVAVVPVVGLVLVLTSLASIAIATG
ncbi:MAG TPA: hypothetical protein VM408_07285, partial [Methylomirabilota bacterium]|nr:hypothetical protein [Methylomirabilota bacterium]